MMADVVATSTPKPAPNRKPALNAAIWRGSPIAIAGASSRPNSKAPNKVFGMRVFKYC